MTAYPSLGENEKLNESVYSNIIKIYWFSVAALIILLSITIPSIKKGVIPIDQIAVSFYMFALGLQSLIFYKKIVLKFQETPSGKILSYILAGSLLLFFVVAIHSGWYTVIGLGLVFLCIKSYQLYSYCVDKNIGTISIKYFRKMSIVYVFLSILGISVGMAVDTGFIPIHIHDGAQQIKQIEDIIKGIPDKQLHNDIHQKLSVLSQWLVFYAQFTKSMILIFAYAFSFLVLISAYKFLVVRKIGLESLYDELEKYYSNCNAPKSDNSPPVLQSASKLLSGILLIIRPFMSSVAGAIGLVIYLTYTAIPHLSMAFSVFLTIFLTSAFGFSINDYFDYKKDIIGHPDRVLPRKIIGRQMIPVFCLILTSLSLYFSSTINQQCFLINIATQFLLSVYSWINNRFGVLSNIITALICSFIFIFGIAASTYNWFVLMSSVAVFFFILGREILLDVRDIISDIYIGKSSVPITFGLNTTLIIVAATFIVTTLVNIYLGFLYAKPNYLLFVTVGCNFLVWYFFLNYVRNRSSKALNRFFVYSRVAFVFIIVGLL